MQNYTQNCKRDFEKPLEFCGLMAGKNLDICASVVGRKKVMQFRSVIRFPFERESGGWQRDGLCRLKNYYMGFSTWDWDSKSRGRN